MDKKTEKAIKAAVDRRIAIEPFTGKIKLDGKEITLEKYREYLKKKHFTFRRKTGKECKTCGWRRFCISEEVDYDSHACWIQTHRKEGQKCPHCGMVNRNDVCQIHMPDYYPSGKKPVQKYADGNYAEVGDVVAVMPKQFMGAKTGYKAKVVSITKFFVVVKWITPTEQADGYYFADDFRLVKREGR